MKRSLILTSVLLISLCSNVAAQPKWRTYTSPDKRFSAELPWNPIYRRRHGIGTVWGSLGPFKGTMNEDLYDLSMYVDEADTSFHILVYDMAERRTDEAFDTEADSIMSAWNGNDKNFVKKGSVAVNGFHGREYLYEKGKEQGRVLILSAKNIIYFVSFHTRDKKGVSRAPVNRVFDSFQPTPR